MKKLPVVLYCSVCRKPLLLSQAKCLDGKVYCYRHFAEKQDADNNS